MRTPIVKRIDTNQPDAHPHSLFEKLALEPEPKILRNIQIFSELEKLQNESKKVQENSSSNLTAENSEEFEKLKKILEF